MIKHIFRYVFSFIFQQRIENRKSAVSGNLEVNYSRGKYVLDTASVNYSFGGLHDVFQKAFGQFNVKGRNIKNVLILGFGSGSVAGILQDEYKLNVSMTGVEKDEAVIGLAEKYFSIDRYKNLTIICADAYDYILDSPPVLYDLIVVDVFVDLLVPENIQDENFISALGKFLSYEGILFYNFIARDAVMRNSGAALYKRLNQLVGYTEWVRLFAQSTENWVFVSQKQKNIKP